MQREERIAGDPEVDQAPRQRRRGREREQVEAPPAAPQPVGAGQHPGLGAQQPGHGQRRHHRQAAARRPRLERGGPQDEGQEGHVDVGARGVEQEGEARAHEDRARERRPQPEARVADPERGPHERHEGQHADQDDQALAVGADQPDERAQREEQRVLGRRGVGLEVGLHAVHQLAPPHEVEVRVVVGVGRHEQRGDQRHRRQRGDDCELPAPHVRCRLARGGPQRHRRARAQQRPRERVLQERGVHHRMGHQGHEGRRHRGRARARAAPRGTAAPAPPPAGRGRRPARSAPARRPP